MVISHKSRVVVQYLVPIALMYTVLGLFLFKGKAPTIGAVLPYWGGMAGLTIAMTLAQDLFPKSTKEFVVFWRVRDRLPGHRAFTEKFGDLSRYDVDNISNIDSLKLLSPAKQQQMFYRTYRHHEKDARVSHYSFRYLAWRDSASSLILTGSVTVPVFGFFPTQHYLFPAIQLAGCMYFAAILAILAARHSANELVYQVLAAETQGAKHAIK